jgi:hypothetical protein
MERRDEGTSGEFGSLVGQWSLFIGHAQFCRNAVRRLLGQIPRRFFDTHAR